MKRIWNTRNAVIGVMIIGAGLLLSTRLRAQGDPETPEDAAKEFVDRVLVVANKNTQPYPPQLELSAFYDLISRNDTTLLGRDGFARLMEDMVRDVRRSRFSTKTVVKKSSLVIDVQLAPVGATLKNMPVVVKREGCAWSVDLVETYALWNKIPRKTALHRISKIAGVVMPGVPATEAMYTRTCQNHLKQLALATLMYSQDYDEKFPTAHQWQKMTSPYVGEGNFNCPKVKGNGYAMNKNYHRATINSDLNPSETVLFYDSKNLKRNAFGTGDDVSHRHLRGVNYAYADGHVSMRPHFKKQNFVREIHKTKTETQ